MCCAGKLALASGFFTIAGLAITGGTTYCKSADISSKITQLKSEA